MRAINKIVKESSINFTGSAVGTVLGYAWLMIMTRYLSQSEVGSFTLAQSISNISLIFVLMGMHRSLDRFIPFYNSAGEKGKIKSILRFIFIFSLTTSIIIGFALFFGAEFLGKGIFENPLLSQLLKIIVISIPLLAVINIVIYAFSGYKELRYNVYLKQILEPSLKILFVLLLAVLGLGVVAWTWLYILTLAISALVGLILLYKKIIQPLLAERTIKIDLMEIVSYSWPISIASILLILIDQIGYLILGLYHPVANVGVYRIYIQIIALLKMILGSTARIYKPVISELIPKGEDEEIREVYARVSKWVLSLTMIGALILALFGAQITGLLFTDAYAVYPITLTILALGTLINGAIGPSGVTLEAFGSTRLVMINSLIAVVVNIGLGLLLIPGLGIVGAAIATAVTLAVNGLLGYSEIFYLYKMQPFSMKTLKYLGIGSFTGLLFWGIKTWLDVDSIPGLLILIILMVGIYFAGFYLTNSLDEVDKVTINRITRFLRITR